MEENNSSLESWLVYFEKIRVFKAARNGLLNRLAWDNRIRSGAFYLGTKFSEVQIMINRNGIGGIGIQLSEVKFIDLRKTNIGESIYQRCFH